MRFILLGMLGLIFAFGIPGLEIAQSREVSQTISPQATPQELIERGRELYRSDRYDEAAATLQQAADLYAAQGNRLNQSLALSYLSLAYQKLGEWQAAQRVSEASVQFAGMGETRGDRIARAVALNSQGHLLLSLGNAETAFERWQNAAAEYQHLNDKEGKFGALVNQAQALEQMGYYRRSCNTLLEAVGAENLSCDEEDIQSLTDRFAEVNHPEIQAIALRSLGNVLRAIGYLNQSQEALDSTWQLVSQTNSNTEKSLTFFSLGNTEQALAKQKQEYGDTDNAQDYRNQAVRYYKQAIAITPSPTIKLLAQLNLFSLLRQSETNPRELQTLLATIQAQMSEMTLNKSLVEARIKLACSLMQCEKLVQGETAELALVSIEEIDRLLQQAVTEAERLEDERLKSYAIGTQGKRYESFLSPQAQKQGDNPNRQKAKNLTQEALELAVQSNAPELRYQWQWQMGRLLAGEGDLEEAIGNYTAAVETLNALRNDLLPINSEVQFSFRDNVEPVYRQLVNLLLTKHDRFPETENLLQSIYYIDSLQLAELENYLRCGTLGTVTIQADGMNRLQSRISMLKSRLENFGEEESTSALIYTIVFSDRIAAIAYLPTSNEFLYQGTELDPSDLQMTLQNSKDIRRSNFAKGDEEPMKRLYEWIVKPFQAELEKNQIDTLIFVLDAPLREIPMAALYDGSEYLVQNYAVTLTSSVQFLNTDTIDTENLKALLAGSTRKRPEFDPLTSVSTQINQIQEWLRNAEVLLGEKFTKTSLREEMRYSNYDLIHLATHGKFSSNPEETFILTDDESEEFEEYSLKLNEFGNLLQGENRPQPIDLLVLSACETASGDRRAVLGIAGVAVKSGANGTIAPIWQADQESATVLLNKFYENLVTKNVSKAEALRLAQESLLEDSNPNRNIPYHWAPFILVGY